MAARIKAIVLPSRIANTRASRRDLVFRYIGVSFLIGARMPERATTSGAVPDAVRDILEGDALGALYDSRSAPSCISSQRFLVASFPVRRRSR